MNLFAIPLVAVALAGADAISTPPLTVMSYNVRFGTADDGPDAWDLRKDRLVALIADHAPDIIGTQECLDFQAAYLVEQLPGYAWIGQGRQEDGTGEMTAILYRKERLIPLESGHLWLSETPDVPGSKSWDSSLPRIATWIKFHDRSSGASFYAYNTHFDHRGEMARLESAKLIEARIRTRHAQDFVVLTGDFNAMAETSAPWTALTEGGLRDTWNVADETRGEANTWNGFATPPLAEARRIDWILVTPGAHVLSFEVDARTEAGRFPSDHMPVIARIQPPRAGG